MEGVWDSSVELDISPEIIMSLYLPSVACLYVVIGSWFELLKYNKLECLILADPVGKEYAYRVSSEKLFSVLFVIKYLSWIDNMKIWKYIWMVSIFKNYCISPLYTEEFLSYSLSMLVHKYIYLSYVK